MDDLSERNVSYRIVFSRYQSDGKKYYTAECLSINSNDLREKLFRANFEIIKVEDECWIKKVKRDSPRIENKKINLLEINPLANNQLLNLFHYRFLNFFFKTSITNYITVHYISRHYRNDLSTETECRSFQENSEEKKNKEVAVV